MPPTKIVGGSALKLHSPAGELVGVGPAYVARLERLGISTVGDLLHYFPRRYDDLRNVQTLDKILRFGEVPTGERIIIKAEVLKTKLRRMHGGRSLVTASAGSAKGAVEAVWFNQPYLAEQLKVGEQYIFAGKLMDRAGQLTLQSPIYEPARANQADQTHTSRLVPIYPETEGLSSKWLRHKLKTVLELAGKVRDDLPADLKKRYGLLDAPEAIRQIHFPDTEKTAQAARFRFDFEQLLLMQLLTQRYRQSWQADKTASRIPRDTKTTKEFLDALPWPLTEDQNTVLGEILTDLDSDTPMLRLLEGDVGSGKTAVAAVAAHQVIRAGHQAAIMAPTEVLARQHAATLEGWFSKLGISTALLLGSQPVAEKAATRKRIADGEVDLIIGTHALIGERVDWARLGLAVIDEQHRFGVKQRHTLASKHTPHLLSMTATPIPRSLALVAFGDQDLSIIESLPSQRPPIATKVIPTSKRAAAFKAVDVELAAGRQAFVVYPVISQSQIGLKTAEAEYERLAGEVFKHRRVGLLHGRLKPDEKTATMERFVAGELDMLVATSVIEVGVDVPNATVMVIEEAQQFGLAQLHQLRGRIGRGGQQAHCYLMPGTNSNEENERLRAMTKTDSGFQLAEVDLELRGPGDLLGTRQSGFDVSMAGLTNPKLLKDAHEAAKDLLAKDPELSKLPRLRKRLADAALPV